MLEESPLSKCQLTTCWNLWFIKKQQFFLPICGFISVSGHTQQANNMASAEIDKIINKLGYSEQDLVNIIVERFGNESPNLKSLTVKDMRMITSDLIVDIFLAYLKSMRIEISSTLPSNPDLLALMDASQHTLLTYMDMSCVLKHIMKKTSEVDFSVNDILFPTAARSLYIISLLENAVAFYNSKQERIADDVESITLMVQEHQELLKQREELRQEANSRALVRVQRANKMKQLEDRIKEEKIAVKSLAEAHKKASNEHDTVNAHVHAIKNEVDNKKKLSLAKMGEINNKKKQIAPSAAHLQAELKERQESLILVNENIAKNTANHEKCQKAAAWNDQFIEWKGKQNAMLQQAKDLKSELLLEKKAAERNGPNAGLGDELETLQEEISADLHSMQTIQDEMRGLQIQKEKKLNSLKKSVAVEEKEKAEMEVMYLEKVRKIEDIQQCCASAREEEKVLLQLKSESTEIVDDVIEDITLQYEQKQRAMGQRWDKVISDVQEFSKL